MMLGTNDAKTYNWNQTEYVADYLEMINIFKNMPSNPEIHLMIPPPLYQDKLYDMQQPIINELFPKLIPEIASQAGLDQEKNIIDLFTPMGGASLNSYEL